MTILIFVVMLGILILSHELGHFMAAKQCGVHVEEFNIGFGPVIFQKEKNGTKYAVRLLPLGGNCMFESYDFDEESGAIRRKTGGTSFPEASVWSRFAIILAGPFMNLILGFLIALILVAGRGVDLPVISAVMEDSAAEAAGILPGDIIRKMDNENIHVYREVRLNSSLNSDGKSFDLTVERNGERFEVTIQPKYSEEDGRYYIGLVGLGELYECKGLDLVRYGFYESEYVVKNTVKSVLLLVSGKLGMDNLSGPVGVANYVDETYQEAKEYGAATVTLSMLELMLLLSVNLGVMNMLPIPGLDGGRLLFLIVEMLRGKPVPPEREGIVNLVGFACLILIMGFALYNDIMKMIR